MISAEQIREHVLHARPDAGLELISNLCPSCQDSLLVAAEDAVEVARLLRDDPELRLDYCSNVTGVDWPERPVRTPPGSAPAGQRMRAEVAARPGCFEVVYHLFSMSLKHGPVVLRMRTENRSDRVRLPSLTPIWHSAEFQEREVFDLYGIRFDGHPDLRRLLMWEEFEGHPMRKDYLPPAEDDVREPFAAARNRMVQ